MRVLLAGWLMSVAAGCAEIIGADFGDARPRPPAACATTLPFGAPRRLPLNDLFAEAWAPRLSADQLTLYFTSLGEEFLATRATLEDEFADPVPMTSINTPAAEMGASVTADGLTYVLESNRTGDVKIFAATRDSLGDAFSTPALVEGINSSAPGVLDIQPYIVPDGSALYFGSTRDAGDYQLYRAERETGSDRFQPPTALASINSLTVDLWPVVSPDELTIYFASARNLADAAGSVDVLMATRANKADDFGDVRVVPGVNSPEPEYPSWISPDGCTLYMTQGPTNTMYVATRTP